jgi:hypothetical protein
VAQGIGPEFKHHYHKKKKERKRLLWSNLPCLLLILAISRAAELVWRTGSGSRDWVVRAAVGWEAVPEVVMPLGEAESGWLKLTRGRTDRSSQLRQTVLRVKVTSAGSGENESECDI